MVWTAPMTAVTNQAFTSQQFNQNIRDNLLELAPAKAGVAGEYFVSIGQNSLASRSIESDIVATSESTSSGVFTDLTTPGPSVTVNMGTSALVFFGARVSSNASGAFHGCAIEVSGASSSPPDLIRGFYQDGVGITQPSRGLSIHRHYLLNPGLNTFTMKYISNSVNTATFQDRELIVMPL